MPKKPTLITLLGKLILYRNTTRCPLFWQVLRQCRLQGRTKANTLRFFYEDYQRRKWMGVDKETTLQHNTERLLNHTERDEVALNH